MKRQMPEMCRSRKKRVVHEKVFAFSFCRADNAIERQRQARETKCKLMERG